MSSNEHEKKISPDCETPNTRMSISCFDVNNDEKTDIVLNDPKFGMFSLF